MPDKVKFEESNSFVFKPQQIFNVQFGWIGYNENNQEVFPNHTTNNGSTFINGDEQIDFILVIEKYYLEER
ncbi:hypothetical protein Q75_14545 [Bacillus coahuilensis p1.1.43]|uniref:Uncharacterized protein n=1 Tax=Bacillus coahuilensis p1.1.43 TaxID=1150625 RepID=A0A147K4Z5_9BACI|nr:hypothetical protein Q75_14545 [Bacillus coahuilensis p1.1.43]